MNKTPGHRTYVLTLTVRNRPGVLVRCAQVYGRRSHNIESLHVTSLPPHHDLSIMTIAAYGNPAAMSQITAQLSKLVDVVDVTG